MWERDAEFYDDSNPQAGLLVYKRSDDCDSEVEIECILNPGDDCE